MKALTVLRFPLFAAICTLFPMKVKTMRKKRGTAMKGASSCRGNPGSFRV